MMPVFKKLVAAPRGVQVKVGALGRTRRKARKPRSGARSNGKMSAKQQRYFGKRKKAGRKK